MQKCLVGFDKNTWRKLENIETSSKYKERSPKQMQETNSLRVNFGWTSPKGATGIASDLREKLDRSPDPEEIEVVGYSGYKQRI